MERSIDTEGTEADRRDATRWLVLAVGVLIPAGLFALLIVLARTPGISQLITDPMFFRRCLVVHVDLALLIWSYAFIGALFYMLPGRTPGTAATRVGGISLAVTGVALIIMGAGVPGAQPILANYVPVIDTPIFKVGLAAFAAGLVLAFADRRLLPGLEGDRGFVAIPASALPGIRAAVVAILLAFVTLAISASTMPVGLDARTHHELLFWGMGHVLQFALEAAMLAAWTILLGGALGIDPIGRGTSSVLFGLLVVPLFAAPLLAAAGTSTATYHVGFTRLMRWGIFPVVTVYLALCLRALVRAVRSRGAREVLGDARVVGFLASALLAVTGFVLGALIRGPNTLVPAHYHAAIGAVTVSFMTVTYALLAAFGAPLATTRLRALARWQPVAYTFGQLAFVAGFALAGTHGMPRKTYGAEQHVRSTVERLGMMLMGAGGGIAVIGGLLFLAIVVAAWRNRPERVATATGSEPWKQPAKSIPSNV